MEGKVVENISKISKGTLSFVPVTGLLYEERNFTVVTSTSVAVVEIRIWRENWKQAITKLLQRNAGPFYSQT